MSYNSYEDTIRPSNNKYLDCPPRMDDGRHFTDYRPKCVAENSLTMKQDSVMNSYDHRLFLINHADEIIKTNAVKAYLHNRCGPCVEPYYEGTMLPEITMQSCDERVCRFDTNDPYGVGIGRQYYSSESEDIFRKRFLEEKEKEQAFFAECKSCTNNMASYDNESKYYPVNGGHPEDFRVSVPGGGVPFAHSE